MNDKELVINFFVEGYTNKNYDYIMEDVVDDWSMIYQEKSI